MVESEDEEEPEELVEKPTSMKNSRSSSKPGNKGKQAGKKKESVSTWYFACDSVNQQKLWIEYLTINASQKNPRFVIDDELSEKL